MLARELFKFGSSSGAAEGSACPVVQNSAGRSGAAVVAVPNQPFHQGVPDVEAGHCLACSGLLVAVLEGAVGIHSSLAAGWPGAAVVAVPVQPFHQGEPAVGAGYSPMCSGGW